METEKGLTLLEVVASLVIISIVLVSFFPFFINAKKISASNMERLVVVNLAEATLDRLKMDPYAFIEKPSEQPSYLSSEKIYSSTSCNSVSDSCKLYKLKVNNKDYLIEVKASQKNDDSKYKLIDIVVTAKNEILNNKNESIIQYSVEGYVSYE